MFHIPCITIVYGTSNGPQHDIGNYLGPCSTAMQHPRPSLTVFGLQQTKGAFWRSAFASLIWLIWAFNRMPCSKNAGLVFLFGVAPFIWELGRLVETAWYIGEYEMKQAAKWHGGSALVNTWFFPTAVAGFWCFMYLSCYLDLLFLWCTPSWKPGEVLCESCKSR